MTDGVREDAAAFIGSTAAFAGLARYRTFGEEGPMYEVLAVNADTVRIHIFDNGEEFDYRMDRALADPLAR